MPRRQQTITALLLPILIRRPPLTAPRVIPRTTEAPS
jgi:hypothetical protein